MSFYLYISYAKINANGILFTKTYIRINSKNCKNENIKCIRFII